MIPPTRRNGRHIPFNVLSHTRKSRLDNTIYYILLFLSSLVNNIGKNQYFWYNSIVFWSRTMSYIQALVLGIIQGLTEFLPVSSSGHLVLFPRLFGWSDQGIAFDVVLHLGTLVAVVIFLRKKLWLIIKSFFNFKNKEEITLQNRHLGWLLIVSIIPAGLAGLLFNSWIKENLRSPLIVAGTLIFWGIILWLADTYTRKQENKKTLNQIGWKQSLFIGCAQVLALVPGTSRSGITMTAGLFSKLDRKSTAEFSFLVSVPIIFLAGITAIKDLFEVGLGNVGLSYLGIGFVAALISGLLAVWGLMKIIQKWSFKPFVIYRILLGLIIIVFFI